MTKTHPTAIVTGAAGGIGEAIAQRLAADGVTVLAVDIKSGPADTHPNIQTVTADLTRPDVIGELMNSETLAGSLDYLVNAAGVAWWGRDGSALEVLDEVFEDVFAINFGVMRRLCSASVPLLRNGSGRAIVNIASMAGLRNMDTPLDAYQVSKAAVVSLSRSLAEQLGPEGIRCNTVCPGAILTPMIEALYSESPQRRVDMELRTPLRRLGTSDDIAAATTFLLSPSASFITGIDLVVDGGWMIQTK